MNSPSKLCIDSTFLFVVSMHNRYIFENPNSCFFISTRYKLFKIFLNWSISNSAAMSAFRFTNQYSDQQQFHHFYIIHTSSYFFRFWNVSTRSTCSCCIHTICRHYLLPLINNPFKFSYFIKQESWWIFCWCTKSLWRKSHKNFKIWSYFASLISFAQR